MPRKTFPRECPLRYNRILWLRKREIYSFKKIIKILGDDFLEHTDAIAVEEPLQISISVLKADSPITNKNISITMRTPGHDKDLAIGFLFTEGIIQASNQIKRSPMMKTASMSNCLIPKT